jgi:hypothetical protein
VTPDSGVFQEVTSDDGSHRIHYSDIDVHKHKKQRKNPVFLRVIARATKTSLGRICLK